jgi:hypothetical protein
MRLRRRREGRGVLHDLDHRPGRADRPERHGQGHHPPDEGPPQQDVDHRDRANVRDAAGAADQDRQKVDRYRRDYHAAYHDNGDKG